MCECFVCCFRSEDANKAFSTAVQMYDTLVKAWAHWGDYLENLFTRERSDHSDFLCSQLLLIRLSTMWPINSELRLNCSD